MVPWVGDFSFQGARCRRCRRNQVNFRTRISHPSLEIAIAGRNTPLSSGQITSIPVTGAAAGWQDYRPCLGQRLNVSGAHGIEKNLFRGWTDQEANPARDPLPIKYPRGGGQVVEPAIGARAEKTR
jgi:hypothetical protein